MFKTKNLFLILIFISSFANAATSYISDDLHTFIHSGPGTKYKIIGSVNTGDRVEIIRKNSKYTLIKDSKGRSGWVNSKYISAQPGLKERLPQLETQLTKVQAQLDEYKTNIESQDSKLEKLENINLTLNKQIEEIQILNANLNDKLDTKKNDLLMRWFSYGGMVAGGGLILGLILPYLIPSRRKKSRW